MMTTATRGGWRRESAGEKGVPAVVPDVQHHYTAFFDDTSVRDLSFSLVPSRDSRGRENARKRATHADRVKR